MQFSNRDLWHILVPVFVEHLLVMMVGMIDTIIISFAGQDPVSGVSLVNQLAQLMTVIFSALVSGGAVVVSQYIGAKEYDKGSRAAGQLCMISTVVSAVLTLAMYLGRSGILRFLFGTVEQPVMDAALIYLEITCLSFPFLGIYNAGAAAFRSLGKTRVTMIISVISNVINLIGNWIGVFVLKAGVAGVAVPTLIARAFSAVVVSILCLTHRENIRWFPRDLFAWDWSMLHRVLHIAVPNSIESGLFQLNKVLLYAIVATFGSAQIAANGAAHNFWNMGALVTLAYDTAFVTVIGRCMGAQDTDAADYYLHKLYKQNLIIGSAWCALSTIFAPIALTYLYNLPDTTKQLTVLIVVIHNVGNAIFYPGASSLAAGLRAAGDVKYTTVVSIIATLFVRLILALVLALWLRMGVVGVTIAMVVDWVVRTVVLIPRMNSGKWKAHKVI